MDFRCDDTLVQMYVDGSMSPVERAILEEHLKTCRACRQHVSLYKGLFWDLENPVEPECPPELASLSDRLMEAWDEAQSPTTWQEASTAWTRRVPGVDLALETAGRVGRSLPRLGWTGLTYLPRLGLSRLRRRGGDGR